MGGLARPLFVINIMPPHDVIYTCNLQPESRNLQGESKCEKGCSYKRSKL